LKAKATIPFASFVYFCCEDNRYMNAYANTPADVARVFSNANLTLQILKPGESSGDNLQALAYYDNLYRLLPQRQYEQPVRIPLDALQADAAKLAVDLRSKYFYLLLKLMPKVTFHVQDLGQTLSLNLCAGTLTPVDRRPDISLYSQPLHFALSNSFGIQTLGVSARMIQHQHAVRWLMYRILFALYNAELYVNWKALFSGQLVRWAWLRRKGLLRQIAYRLKRAKRHG
jgi:UDP-MurNAc hydroxylase